MNTKIKDDVTLKQLKENGFEFANYELLYKVKERCYLAFEFNNNVEEYLYFIGIEMFNCMEEVTTREQEEAFKRLKDLGLIEEVEE